MQRFLIGVVAVLGLGGAALMVPEARVIVEQLAGLRSFDTRAGVDKANRLIELWRSTERALESWERYASWVDVKAGPTGDERYIDYGLYEVPEVERIARELEDIAGAKASVPKLDTALKAYVDAYVALAPVLNRAEAYYDKKQYLADGLAEGKALHPRIVALSEAFARERAALEPELRAFVREVERREVADLEKREGRSRAWAVGQVMTAANRLADMFPRVRPVPFDQKAMEEMLKSVGPDTPAEKLDELIMGQQYGAVPPIDMKRFEEVLGLYAEAVAVFDRFAREKPEGLAEFRDLPGKLLEQARAIAGPLALHKGRPFFKDAEQLMRPFTATYFDMIARGAGPGKSVLRTLL